MKQTEFFPVANDDAIVGFALTEGRDLHFRAADPRFNLLDGSRFRRRELLDRAVDNLSRVIRADLLAETLSRPHLAAPANDSAIIEPLTLRNS